MRGRESGLTSSSEEFRRSDRGVAGAGIVVAETEQASNRSHGGADEQLQQVAETGSVCSGCLRPLQQLVDGSHRSGLIALQLLSPSVAVEMSRPDRSAAPSRRESHRSAIRRPPTTAYHLDDPRSPAGCPRGVPSPLLSSRSHSRPSAPGLRCRSASRHWGGLPLRRRRGGSLSRKATCEFRGHSTQLPDLRGVLRGNRGTHAPTRQRRSGAGWIPRTYYVTSPEVHWNEYCVPRFPALNPKELVPRSSKGMIDGASLLLHRCDEESIGNLSHV